jgi:hypothetical protein
MVAVCLCAATTSRAQRVQFNSMVDDGMGAATSPPMSPVSPPPTFSAAPPPSFTTPGAAPLTTPPSFDPYGSPTAPGASPPPFTPYAQPAPYSPYDPAPYSPTPQALYPEGIQMPQMYPQNGFSIGQPMRFLQEVRLRDTQLLNMGSQPLSVNDVETSATFALPFFRSNAPLLVTPGFGMHFFGGPQTAPPAFADLPPRTYDAYVDGGWHPQFNPWFGANLGVRVGAYTDFNTFNTHSIRIMGRGLGVVTLTPTVQIAAGVVYIDRVQIKLLPAGGIIWTPNPDARYEILFPNPKLARRLTTIGNTDVWVYGTGEYGGGSWTIQRIGFTDQADYNDIRVGGGIEGYGYRGMHAFFESAYVFDRKIIYRSGTPNYNPSDTIELRAGLSY